MSQIVRSPVPPHSPGFREEGRVFAERRTGTTIKLKEQEASVMANGLSAESHTVCMGLKFLQGAIKASPLITGADQLLAFRTMRLHGLHGMVPSRQGKIVYERAQTPHERTS
jgi:hypothetical protein